MKYRLAVAAIALVSTNFATQAWAQSESLLVQPALPDDFDRGRNISVLQRARPDYDPTGIRAGSFEFFPTVTVSGGYSDNIYFARQNKIDAAYVVVNPAFRLESDWSRHELKLRGETQIQRYFSESPRNQTPWNLGGLAALDVGGALRITPELQAARLYENAFSGETTSERAVLSSYLRLYAGVRSEYTSGQGKFTLAFDTTDYEFSDVKTASGVVFDQSDRDRNLLRLTGQGQFAFTPSVSAYVQGNFVDTNYDRDLLTGAPNRDSKGYRVLGGFNFDLSGLMRGNIGLGYTRRDYNNAIYSDVSGISAEVRFEYFPNELTTFTLAARRVIEDSNIGSSAAFFDNRALLQVDHEFLVNLIVSATGEFARQNYIDSPVSIDVYRIGMNANYLSSNTLGLNFKLGYTGRSVNDNIVGRGFGEFVGQIGVVFKR